MKIQIYIALAKNGDDIILLGAGQNSRLVEIIKDSFIMKPNNVEFEAQVQTHELIVNWEENENIVVDMMTKPENDFYGEKED